MQTDLLITVFLVVAAAQFANARVGENIASIEKRYGKHLNEDIVNDHQTFRLYVSDGLKILVTFLDGVSQAEAFQKTDGSDLSRGEIEGLLEANSNGKQWIRASHPRITDEMSKLPDDSMIAGHNSTEHRLLIFTHVWSDFAETRRKSQAGRKQKDF